MEQLARALLLLLVIGLVVNLVRHGRAGVRDWLAAKFLGRPAAAR